MRYDGLTEEEGAVMDALVEAVAAFDELDRQHPDEQDDFYGGIHRCQDLLAVRAMRRLYPRGWVTFDGSTPVAETLPDGEAVHGGPRQATRPEEAQAHSAQEQGEQGWPARRGTEVDSEVTEAKAPPAGGLGW